MKKITLLAALFFAVIAARAQDVYFEDNFDDQDVSDWTLVDSDGDGIQFGDLFQVGDGEGGAITPVSLISRSWQGTPLTPDNWAISPAIDLSSADGTVTVTWTRQVSESFPGENYTVYVGTSNDIADLMESDLTLNENFVGQEPSVETNTPMTITLDATEMIGESEVYVAFRHFDCTDADYLSIDDFRVGQEVEVPNAVTDPTPEDGATDVAVDQDADGVFFIAFEWTPATTGSEATSYEFYISNPNGADPTAVQSIGTTPNTAVIINGMTFGDLYYWKVVALNEGGEATGSATWSFTSEDEAGLEDFAQDAFNQYVQAGVLNVESNTQIQSITLFNILGQQVITQKINGTKGNISLAQLNSGIYLAKVQLDGQTKTFKFVKK